MTQSPYPPPPKKGLSGLAIVGIGCGVLFVLGCVVAGILAVKGFSKFKEVAGDFQKNPGKAAATLMVKANPELELVGTDDDKGEITIKNKKTGEVTTMSFDEINQGRFKVTDSKGNETSIDGSAANQGRVTIKGPDGETVINGDASEMALPAGLPVYPGAVAKPGGMRAQRNGMVSVIASSETSDPVAKVKEFYESKLKADGFEVNTNVINLNVNDTAIVNGTKNDGKQKANAMINRQNGKTSITLTAEGPK